MKDRGGVRLNSQPHIFNLGPSPVLHPACTTVGAGLQNTTQITSAGAILKTCKA